MKHVHHIMPKHRGGTNDIANLIEVEVVSCDKDTQCHAMWHFCEWQLYKLAEDYIAWRGLSGFMGREEIIERSFKTPKVIEGRRRGGKKSGANNVKSGHLKKIAPLGGKATMSKITPEEQSRRGRCYWDFATKDEKEERARKISETTLLSMTQEKRKERSKKAGLAAAISLTKEQKAERGRRGGSVSSKILYEDPDHPELGRFNAGNLVLKQKKLGLPHDRSNRVRV